MPPYILLRAHCVEEGWHGGCERYEANCSNTQATTIHVALNHIDTLIDTCLSLDGLDDLRDCIHHAYEHIIWDCRNLDDSIVGQSSGDEIALDPDAFASSASRFEAIVFHEIIHFCGGTELDSEGFENHCYRGNGATAPTTDDFPKFRDDGGRWLNWNGSTGNVTTKDGDSLNVNTASFVDPSPPSGDGGWI